MAGNDEEKILDDMREVFGKDKRSRRNLALFILVLSVTSIAYYLISTPASNAEDSGVYFVSGADSLMQGQIQEVTGYNWTSFIKAGDSEKAKLAGMLLLASEVSILGDQFAYLNKSAGINNSEWAGINLARLDVSDTGKSGLLALINNTKAIQQFYLSKGMSSSETRLNRLGFLYAYFERNGMPEGDVPADAQFLAGDLLGMSTESYEQMLVLMTARYNVLV